MTEVARRDLGVLQQRHRDGTRVWTGTEVDLRRALDLAHRNGRLAYSGAVEPVVNRPGVHVVRVRLLDAPAGRPAATVTRRRLDRLPGSGWRRYVWMGIAATGALGFVAFGVAALLGAIAALLPVLGGVLVVAVIGFVILRIFGGGGGGSDGGGGFGGLYISQSIRIGR